MPTRAEHQAAVARRLALLRAEIEDDARAPAVDDARPRVVGASWWDGHTHVTDEELAPVVLLPTGRETAPRPGERPEPTDPVGPARSVPPASPVEVPIPGRHAARRGVGARWLPEAVRGRVTIGPGQLTVVALVVAVALALTCWWLVRGRASTVAPPALPPVAASPLVPLAAAGPSPAASAGAGSGSPTGSALVTVDVEGKVGRPGIVIVPAGSRVTDALRAAGGVLRRRFLGGLNLAAVLVDGQQIVVGGPTSAGAGPVSSAPGAAGAGGTGAGGTGGAALVNLNTATAEQLDTLPGVGPVTAQAILTWREQNGGFTSVQELLEVDGIGPATLAKLTPHVTV